jgi:hypothetical protein
MLYAFCNFTDFEISNRIDAVFLGKGFDAAPEPMAPAPINRILFKESLQDIFPDCSF